LSPGTPYKYAPQHVWVFAEIARRLGRCTIVFFGAKPPWTHITSKLFSRVSASFSDRGLNFSDYCVVLPWQEKSAFYGLMQRADILLDTIGFSGFNTAMQAVECSLPIVTREGRFMRGRLASGILRTLELSELIAEDECRYVDLAVELIRNPGRLSGIRRRMQKRRDILFNDIQAVHALQECLLNLSRNAGQQCAAAQKSSR
jgi:predicted O-linked N-acetylglucosamine transferase (SPINDLY family)